MNVKKFNYFALDYAFKEFLINDNNLSELLINLKVGAQIYFFSCLELSGVNKVDFIHSKVQNLFYSLIF